MCIHYWKICWNILELNIKYIRIGQINTWWQLELLSNQQLFSNPSINMETFCCCPSLSSNIISLKTLMLPQFFIFKYTLILTCEDRIKTIHPFLLIADWNENNNNWISLHWVVLKRGSSNIGCFKFSIIIKAYISLKICALKTLCSR